MCLSPVGVDGDLRKCGASPNACRTLSLAFSLFGTEEDWEEAMGMYDKHPYSEEFPIKLPAAVEVDGPERKLRCLLRDTVSVKERTWIGRA